MKEEIKQIAMKQLKEFGIKVIELAGEYLVKTANELKYANDSNVIAKESEQNEK
jgi:hypothetical protein